MAIPVAQKSEVLRPSATPDEFVYCLSDGLTTIVGVAGFSGNSLASRRILRPVKIAEPIV